MPRIPEKRKDFFRKYGVSLATVLAIGTTIFALFRVGFKVQERNGKRKKSQKK